MGSPMAVRIIYMYTPMAVRIICVYMYVLIHRCVSGLADQHTCRFVSAGTHAHTVTVWSRRSRAM